MSQYPEQIELVDIESVQLDPDNTREHPDENIEAIRASLRQFGQRTPLVVDSDGLVRKGNGTLQAARLEGWTEIAVVRSKLQGSEAAAYSIVDNRTTDMSYFDHAKLSASLQAIEADDKDMLKATGLSEAQIRNMCMEAETEEETVTAEWQDMPECVNENQLPKKQLTVNFQSLTDLQDFAKLLGQPLTEKTKSVWYPESKEQHAVDVLRYT